MVAMIGIDTGITMRKKVPNSVHPSIVADSSSPSGIVCMNDFTIMMLNALAAPGMISDQRLSSIPRSLTRINVGIIPPLNSVVKNTIISIGLRNGKCDFDSAYARVNVTIRFSAVPTTVIKMVTPKARIKSPCLKI